MDQSQGYAPSAEQPRQSPPPLSAPTPVVGRRDDAASWPGARADQRRPVGAAVRPPPKRSRARLMAGVPAVAVMIAVVGGAAVFLAGSPTDLAVFEPVPVPVPEPVTPEPVVPEAPASAPALPEPTIPGPTPMT